MSQTSIIAGVLVIGFIVYITMKNHLPQYLAVFGLGGSSSTSAGSTTAQGPTAQQNSVLSALGSLPNV